MVNLATRLSLEVAAPATAKSQPEPETEPDLAPDPDPESAGLFPSPESVLPQPLLDPWGILPLAAVAVGHVVPLQSLEEPLGLVP